MQVLAHESGQETSSGNGIVIVEPNLIVTRLVVNVTQISVNLLGNITIKAQSSPDGTNWFDMPNLATGALTATGSVAVNLSTPFRSDDDMRIVWTFSNANSITFSAYIVGEK